MYSSHHTKMNYLSLQKSGVKLPRSSLMVSSLMVSQDYEIITINKEGNTEKSHCGAVMSSGQTQAPGAPRPLLEGPRGRLAGWL